MCIICNLVLVLPPHKRSIYRERVEHKWGDRKNKRAKTNRKWWRQFEFEILRWWCSGCEERVVLRVCERVINGVGREIVIRPPETRGNRRWFRFGKMTDLGVIWYLYVHCGFGRATISITIIRSNRARVIRAKFFRFGFLDFRFIGETDRTRIA